MIDHSPMPSFGAESPAARVPRAAMRAYLAAVSGLGCAAAVATVMMALAADGDGEARRISGSASGGYGQALVGALAVHMSRPLR